MKRKFHKAVYFLVDLKTSSWEDNRFEGLVRRLNEWAVLRPWREEKKLFGEEGRNSARGTSTPFSHYSSFDSLNTVESTEPRDPIEKLFFITGKARVGASMEKSDCTGHKSKSYFSKSLSVLDKANRAFNEAEADESHLSRKKDVRLTDVNPHVSSGYRDVLYRFTQRFL